MNFQFLSWHTKDDLLFQESNASNKKALESQTNKVSDINKEVNVLGKEIFEIKILVNENKDSDDKNQASVNKKLQDIFSAKGNVNDQLNNLLYMLTNAEVFNRYKLKLTIPMYTAKIRDTHPDTWLTNVFLFLGGH